MQGYGDLWRFILVQRFHRREGCSLGETAGILRIPEGTAKSRLYRARQQLKKELKEYDE